MGANVNLADKKLSENNHPLKCFAEHFVDLRNLGGLGLGDFQRSRARTYLSLAGKSFGYQFTGCQKICVCSLFWRKTLVLF